MAKLTTEEFIEAIKELSVLELNDLVKACEEEFGVSAAAGVVVAAGAGAVSYTHLMVENGEMLLINVQLHKNRRTMKASCQIQATPKFNYYEE